jgi:hypothetical protein
VPERFMGPSVKPARGVTDESGACLLAVEGEEIEGVHCGIFRIEVSKPDANGKETIPARYNSASTLGVDTGLRGRPEGGLELRLSRS